jgi:hypothetical protein
MSLETRIAVIGVVGALTGTLVGGLVTYAITQQQISSQKSESRRADRLNAYSSYFGDAARLWTQVVDTVDVTPRPTRLQPSERQDLKELQATLLRDYALVALVAPDDVRSAAQSLNGANTTVWNALNSVPIDYALYSQAHRQIYPKDYRDSLLRRFTNEARSDLDTSN